MSHHQIKINRPVSFAEETLLRTATFGRLVSLLHGGKEICTTGLEMTTVVSGGDVSCLLQNGQHDFSSKNKWVFS